MDKNFNPKQIETYWYKDWENSGYFTADPDSKKEPFSIMIPPPNVTGSLHMGHGFQNSLIDTLARYKRMNGYDVLWQVGTDHAGIATQLLVERKLESDGVTKEIIGREEFIKKVWEWKKTSGNTITKQLRRLGASVDWSRETFTMDEIMSDSVQKVFIDLYTQGLIYKGTRLVNWDSILQTALSDLEVESKEEDGFMWVINYPLSEGGHIPVATTRPETMFGDAALAVNPSDKRFKKYIGKSALIPFLRKEIPIISDGYVDKKFGTGCLKITPAHDFNDYEMGLRNKLPLINILNKNGTLNSNTPIKFCGLTIKDARKKIINDLKDQNLLVDTKNHRLTVPRGEKSGSILEPMLTSQWFLNTNKLSKKAISVVKNNETTFIPKNWENTYFAWMENIQDWCISRQLWWGHRIPAWYDSEKNIYVGKDENEIRNQHKISKKTVLMQDEDVLDTWFSSALWTFSSLGWPKNNSLVDRYHPTNVLITGFDIIFFWVARMIMMTNHFIKEVPFKEVVIHGLVKDSEGQKMSKSKGNILDPLDVIDGINLESLLKKSTSSLMQPSMKKKIVQNLTKQYPRGIKANGTDALRLTFCSLASGSRDVNFDLARVEGYKNFCNKLWNATRFLTIKLDKSYNLHKAENLDKTDQWIERKLELTIKKTRKALDSYRFDLATQTIYEFIWNDFCDWYIELIKIKLNDETVENKDKETTLSFAFNILERTLRMIHPIMPFISEEIWQQLKPIHKSVHASIMIAPYPSIKKHASAKALKDIEWIKDVISGLRNIRGELKIKPSIKIECLLQHGTKKDKTLIEEFEKIIVKLAGLKDIKWISPQITPPPSSLKVSDKLKILVPLKGLINISEEINRLSKTINKLEKEALILSKKLNNLKFIENAPQELITEQKIRFNKIQNESSQLRSKLSDLKK